MRSATRIRRQTTCIQKLGWSMIPKSGHRFSEKIMPKQIASWLE